MFSLLWYAGMVLVGILISIILISRNNSNKKFKSEYDERQEVVRGRSYKWGYYTAIVLFAVFTLLDLGGIVFPVEQSVLFFGALAVSASVQVAYSLWNDAYWGINNKLRNYVVMFIVLGIINGLSGAMAYVDGRMIVDGILTHSFISFECVLIFVVFGIVCLVKSVVKKSEVDEDEES